MSLPDNFNAHAFARAYGAPRIDRRAGEVETAVQHEITQNRKIADTLQAAITAIRTIGEPAHGYLNPGYEFQGMLDMLQDLLPDLEPNSIEVMELRERLMDRARAGEAL